MIPIPSVDFDLLAPSSFSSNTSWLNETNCESSSFYISLSVGL